MEPPRFFAAAAGRRRNLNRPAASGPYTFSKHLSHVGIIQNVFKNNVVNYYIERMRFRGGGGGVFKTQGIRPTAKQYRLVGDGVGGARSRRY